MAGEQHRTTSRSEHPTSRQHFGTHPSTRLYVSLLKRLHPRVVHRSRGGQPSFCVEDVRALKGSQLHVLPWIRVGGCNKSKAAAAESDGVTRSGEVSLEFGSMPAAAEEKSAAEEAAAQKAAAEKKAAEKTAAEEAAEKAEAEKAEAERADKMASQKAAAEKAATEKGAVKIAAAEKAAAEKAAAEKAAAEKAAAEAGAERVAMERAAAEKAAAEKAASEKAAAENAAAEKASADKMVAEETTAENLDPEDPAAEKAWEASLSPEQLAALQIFRAIDKDRSGSVERDEFVAFFLLSADEHACLLDWWQSLAALEASPASAPPSSISRQTFVAWAVHAPEEFAAARLLADRPAPQLLLSQGEGMLVSFELAKVQPQAEIEVGIEGDIFVMSTNGRRVVVGSLLAKAQGAAATADKRFNKLRRQFPLHSDKQIRDAIDQHRGYAGEKLKKIEPMAAFDDVQAANTGEEAFNSRVKLQSGDFHPTSTFDWEGSGVSTCTRIRTPHHRR